MRWSAELIFITVGTPADEDGSADLSHVLNVAQQIASFMGLIAHDHQINGAGRWRIRCSPLPTAELLRVAANPS